MECELEMDTGMAWFFAAVSEEQLMQLCWDR